jgi:hypothetical protein
MSKYKQLTDAYALNHEALVEHRKHVRDSVNAMRLALLGYMGIGDRNSDIVSLRSATGDDLFVPLAHLEHGENLEFQLVIALGGERGLPEMSFTIAAEVEKQNGKLVLGVPALAISQVLENNDSYFNVAEVIFESVMASLDVF